MRPEEVPDLIPVKSSNVAAIGYIPDTRSLFVQFHNAKKPGSEGPIYRYRDVPSGVFSRFRKASSKGGFMWMHVRNQFGYDVWTGRAWRSEGGVKGRRERK